MVFVTSIMQISSLKKPVPKENVHIFSQHHTL